MKLKIKKLIIIIFSFIVIFTIFFLTDTIRIKNDLRPIFVIEAGRYKDGGSIKYIGLTYIVYLVKNIEEDGDKEKNVNYGYHMVPWFSGLDDLKEDIISKNNN